MPNDTPDPRVMLAFIYFLRWYRSFMSLKLTDCIVPSPLPQQQQLVPRLNSSRFSQRAEPIDMRIVLCVRLMEVLIKQKMYSQWSSLLQLSSTQRPSKYLPHRDHPIHHHPPTDEKPSGKHPKLNSLPTLISVHNPYICWKTRLTLTGTLPVPYYVGI